jgi:hypothetical protein
MPGIGKLSKLGDPREAEPVETEPEGLCSIWSQQDYILPVKGLSAQCNLRANPQGLPTMLCPLPVPLCLILDLTSDLAGPPRPKREPEPQSLV